MKEDGQEGEPRNDAEKEEDVRRILVPFFHKRRPQVPRLPDDPDDVTCFLELYLAGHGISPSALLYSPNIIFQKK